MPDAGDACPFQAAATANGCPAPVNPFPTPPNPLPTPPPPGGTTGTPGADVFVGAAGTSNVFRAGAGNDRLTGGPLADLLCGEAGNDQIDASRAPISCTATPVRGPSWRRWPARGTT